MIQFVPAFKIWKMRLQRFAMRFVKVFHPTDKWAVGVDRAFGVDELGAAIIWIDGEGKICYLPHSATTGSAARTIKIHKLCE